MIPFVFEKTSIKDIVLVKPKVFGDDRGFFMETYKKFKTEYDLYYIKNRNIFLDLQIVLKTLETIIGMRGEKIKQA